MKSNIPRPLWCPYSLWPLPSVNAGAATGLYLPVLLGSLQKAPLTHNVSTLSCSSLLSNTILQRKSLPSLWNYECIHQYKYETCTSECLQQHKIQLCLLITHAGKLTAVLQMGTALFTSQNKLQSLLQKCMLPLKVYPPPTPTFVTEHTYLRMPTMHIWGDLVSTPHTLEGTPHTLEGTPHTLEVHHTHWRYTTHTGCTPHTLDVHHTHMEVHHTHWRYTTHTGGYTTHTWRYTTHTGGTSHTLEVHHTHWRYTTHTGGTPHTTHFETLTISSSWWGRHHNVKSFIVW